MGSGANGSISMLVSPYLISDLGSAALLFPIAPNLTPGLEMAITDTTNYNQLNLSNFTWPSEAVNVASIAKNANIKILASCWSPPIWMKDTTQDMYICSPQPCTVTGLEGGLLRTDMYNAFAEWVYGCLLKFKLQTGYDIYSFSPQTEPQFAEPYESCVYSPEELMQATKVTGQKLDSNGINTKLFYGEILFAQNEQLEYFQAVNNDSICKNLVNAFAIHISDDDGLNVTGTGWTSNYYKQSYNECQRVDPIKEFWLEMDSYTPSSNPPIEDALLEACHFYNGMYYGNLNMWMYCFYNTNPLEDNKVYYLYKQLIRFIRPNSIRVQSSSNDNKVYTLAFKNDSLTCFTIVLINSDTLNDKIINITFAGTPGKFDMFCTSPNYNCDWIGQTNLSNIPLPKKSILTLVNVGINKLPNISVPDTIVLLINSGMNTFNLTGINDGGEGNQPISISAQCFPTGPNLLTNLSINYISPESTGKLYLTPASDTGHTTISMVINDSSNALNGFYSKKFIDIPLYVIPFINKAPTMNDIADQYYPMSAINKGQLLKLTGVTDGNDGSQVLTLLAASSDTNIASIVTLGTTNLLITPLAEGTIMVTLVLKNNGYTFLGGSNSITKTFKVVIGSGINSLYFPTLSTLFPNPADDYFIIENPDLRYNEYTIFNAQAAVMQENNLPEEVNFISVKNLPCGLFIVKLSNKTETKFNKLLIIR